MTQPVDASPTIPADPLHDGPPPAPPAIAQGPAPDLAAAPASPPAAPSVADGPREHLAAAMAALLAAHQELDVLGRTIETTGVQVNPAEVARAHAAYLRSIAPLLPRPEVAQKYVTEAQMLRRRAKGRAPQERAELEQRAYRFEVRAPYKRDGQPMPAELRTKAEAIEIVDALRHSLFRALALVFDQLAPEDFASALGAIRDPAIVVRRGPNKAQPTPDEVARVDAAVKTWIDATVALVEQLGVRVQTQEILPFVVDLVAAPQ